MTYRYNPLGNRKPQTETAAFCACLPGFINLEKRLKNPLLQVIRQTRTIIGNFDNDRVTVVFQFDLDMLGVAGRIVHQI